MEPTRDVTLSSKGMKNGSNILLFVVHGGLKRGFSEVDNSFPSPPDSDGTNGGEPNDNMQ